MAGMRGQLESERDLKSVGGWGYRPAQLRTIDGILNASLCFEILQIHMYWRSPVVDRRESLIVG